MTEQLKAAFAKVEEAGRKAIEAVRALEKVGEYWRKNEQMEKMFESVKALTSVRPISSHVEPSRLIRVPDHLLTYFHDLTFDNKHGNRCRLTRPDGTGFDPDDLVNQNEKLEDHFFGFELEAEVSGTILQLVKYYDEDFRIINCWYE